MTSKNLLPKLIHKSDLNWFLNVPVAALLCAMHLGACSTEQPIPSQVRRNQRIPTPVPTARVNELGGSDNLEKLNSTTPGGLRELAALKADSEALNTLKQEIAARREVLERERDRVGKLSFELQGDTAAGCMANQRIEKFEILVQGTHLGPSAKFDSKDHMPPSGSPAQIRMLYGDALAQTVSDEEAAPVFRNDGRLISTEFNASRIADIQFVKIIKGGIGFISNRICVSQFIFFTSCHYENNEVNRYRLDGVTLKVNDEVLYKKDAISHTFEGDKREWTDMNISLNPEFLRLMARTDCPQKQ